MNNNISSQSRSPHEPNNLQLTSIEHSGLEFDVGRHVLESRGTLVLGMSVGSGRFNQNRTHTLLSWAGSVSDQVLLMITDGPAIHTRLGLGESVDIARKYCQKKGEQLRRYSAHELERFGTPCRLFDWSAFYQHEIFNQKMRYVEQLYQSNTEFRQDCQAQTARVLNRELAGVLANEQQVGIAVRYIFDEFAALLAAPTILGCPQIAYVYCDDWIPYQKLIQGKYDRVLHPELGLVIYKIPDLTIG